MTTIDISFVIPVYNCSEYIERCLWSIIALNKYEYSFEIIIVNDGSTDDSIYKVSSFIEEVGIKNKLRIIETSHNGPGNARNVGLANALGVYVWFVDADDEIITGNVKFLLEQAYAYGLDILTFNIYLVYNDGRNAPWKELNQDFLNGNGKMFVKNNWDYLGTPWKYIYRRHFLIDNQIKFPIEILHEDEVFSVNAFMLCERMGISNMYCYKYYKENGKIMSTMSAKRISSLFYVCEVLFDLYLRQSTCNNDFLSLPLLKRIVLMIQQSLMLYEKTNEVYMATLHQIEVIDKIKKELHSSKYLGVIQKTFGRNVICIFDKLEKKMLLC